MSRTSSLSSDLSPCVFRRIYVTSRSCSLCHKGQSLGRGVSFWVLGSIRKTGKWKVVTTQKPRGFVCVLCWQWTRALVHAKPHIPPVYMGDCNLITTLFNTADFQWDCSRTTYLVLSDAHLQSERLMWPVYIHVGPLPMSLAVHKVILGGTWTLAWSYLFI